MKQQHIFHHTLGPLPGQHFRQSAAHPHAARTPERGAHTFGHFRRRFHGGKRPQKSLTFSLVTKSTTHSLSLTLSFEKTELTSLFSSFRFTRDEALAAGCCRLEIESKNNCCCCDCRGASKTKKKTTMKKPRASRRSTEEGLRNERDSCHWVALALAFAAQWLWVTAFRCTNTFTVTWMLLPVTATTLAFTQSKC